MSFSDWVEVKLLNLLFSNVSYSVPEVYAALWIGNPGEAGTGEGGAVEVSGNDYARVDSIGKWSGAAETPTKVTNLEEITFPMATPDSWGEVTHFAIMDSLTGGNMLAYGSLAIPRTITAGCVARFDSGALNIFLD